jgi:hydrogenase maturation factor
MTDCDDGHCVTCSDEALPLRVTERRGVATVLCEDVEVMTDLVGEVDVGDVLLVHAGVAIARVDA